ncbi:MAG TPA: hypothetical protein VFJ25_04645 [Casimicrobiaceae bacterium]|nr:hypothetical protein [Casimicrobiaceae bacterium]
MQGIAACGDVFTSTYDTGADWYLCWGWPQAEQVMRDGAPAERIICVDAHPYALMAGDRSGDRILQLGNWGALAAYPPGEVSLPRPRDRSTPTGPVLVLGQVRSTEQLRGGLVDVWYTAGCDEWTRRELGKPHRRFREHPREYARLFAGERQPTLAEDLHGCSGAISWNSTAAVHAQLLGFPATAAEAHGWAHLSLERLEALRVSPAELRSGRYWDSYREWLTKEMVA